MLFLRTVRIFDVNEYSFLNGILSHSAVKKKAKSKYIFKALNLLAVLSNSSEKLLFEKFFVFRTKFVLRAEL